MVEPLANHTPAVCCWNCDHFQRYDPEPRPGRCDGECRLEPVQGALFTSYMMPDPQDPRAFGHNTETAFVWPHITCGLRMRCSRFEPTKEPGLPQSPLSFVCQHTAPTNLNDWIPWVKPGREKRVCWTCLYFEPAECQHKNAAQPDRGGCLYFPPRPRALHYFDAMLPRVDIGATPTINSALSLWCSKWEGPRPELGHKPDEDPPKTHLDQYTHWEAGRERLVWLSALHFAQIRAFREKLKRCEQKLEKIEKVK